MYDHRQHKSWHDDASINYLNMVKVHQQVVAYCEKQQWQEEIIHTHFLMSHNLTKPGLGYLQAGEAFAHVTYSPERVDQAAVFIFSAIEYDESLHDRIRQDGRFTLEKRFTLKKAWCEIFVRAH